jgi:hypothetical protein
MVEITDPDLNQVVEHYEEMIEALRRYRETLEARRERYEAEKRDPKTYASVVALNLRRLDRLEEELEREAYDLLKLLLDGTGVLASVDQGRWI